VPERGEVWQVDFGAPKNHSPSLRKGSEVQTLYRAPSHQRFAQAPRKSCHFLTSLPLCANLFSC
jgi:hypothetical protein